MPRSRGDYSDASLQLLEMIGDRFHLLKSGGGASLRLAKGMCVDFDPSGERQLMLTECSSVAPFWVGCAIRKLRECSL